MIAEKFQAGDIVIDAELDDRWMVLDSDPFDGEIAVRNIATNHVTAIHEDRLRPNCRFKEDLTLRVYADHVRPGSDSDDEDDQFLCGILVIKTDGSVSFDPSETFEPS